MRAVLASLLLFACTDRSAREWANQLDPLMIENGLLADELLLVAADIYNDDADDDAVVARFTQRVVPVAEILAARASAVQPPANWAGRHAELVDLWSRRGTQYRALSEALVIPDQTGFNDALLGIQKMADEEDRWFQQVGSELAVQGATLRQYP